PEISDSSLNQDSPVINDYVTETNNSPYSNDIPFLTRTTPRLGGSLASTQQSQQHTATRIFSSPNTQSYHSQSFPNNISQRHLHSSNSNMNPNQQIYPPSTSSGIQFSTPNTHSGFLPPVYPSTTSSHLPFLPISSAPAINNNRLLSSVNIPSNPSRVYKIPTFLTTSDVPNSYADSASLRTLPARPELSAPSNLYNTAPHTSSYQSIATLAQAISSVQQTDMNARNGPNSEDRKYVVHDGIQYCINNWVMINDPNKRYRGRIVKITEFDIIVERTDGSKTKVNKTELEKRKVTLSPID
ncbi:hypothetical protein HK096_006396, partial [Nowakowskiella sp. JEL0078]